VGGFLLQRLQLEELTGVLYLTQAFVDYESARKCRLSDSYSWHKAVWDAFPGQPDRNRDFLTRLDRQKQGFGLLIFVPRSSGVPAMVFRWRDLANKRDPRFVLYRRPLPFSGCVRIPQRK
jgi:hypothetical protein